MSQDRSTGEGSCCGPSIRGLRRLTFPDGTQVGITGLEAVMDKLYREGRRADEQVAADVMAQLKSENYFTPSARQAYEELFLREYQRYLEMKSMESEKNATAGNEGSQKAKKKGLLSRLKGGKKPVRERAD